MYHSRAFIKNPLEFNCIVVNNRLSPISADKFIELECAAAVVMAEQICLHCKKSVVSSAECLRCGGSFHPACLVQASEAKGRQCRHIDARGLLKEVDSQSKLLQKMTLKISALEESIKKSDTIIAQQNDQTSKIISELTERITALEEKLADYQGSDNDCRVAEIDSQLTQRESQTGLIALVSEKLKIQSEEISCKLDNVVGAIKSTNKELVRFLAQSSTSLEPPINNIGSAVAASVTGTPELLPAKQSAIVRGTNSGPSDISAAIPRKWFYVGNLDSECTTDSLIKHLDTRGLKPLSCEKLQRDGEDKASFKISVTPDKESSILNGDNWPANIIVKPFIFRKMPRNNRSTQDNRNFRRGSEHYYRRRNRRFQ